jgi:hypothetical protein
MFRLFFLIIFLPSLLNAQAHVKLETTSIDVGSGEDSNIELFFTDRLKPDPIFTAHTVLSSNPTDYTKHSPNAPQAIPVKPTGPPCDTISYLFLELTPPNGKYGRLPANGYVHWFPWSALLEDGNIISGKQYLLDKNGLLEKIIIYEDGIYSRYQVIDYTVDLTSHQIDSIQNIIEQERKKITQNKKKHPTGNLSYIGKVIYSDEARIPSNCGRFYLQNESSGKAIIALSSQTLDMTKHVGKTIKVKGYKFSESEGSGACFEVTEVVWSK